LTALWKRAKVLRGHGGDENGDNCGGELHFGGLESNAFGDDVQCDGAVMMIDVG